MRIKYLVLILVMLLFVSSAGCKETNEKQNDHLTYESNIPESFEGILRKKKLYITSIGQSMDMENFLVYLEFLRDEYNFEYVEDTFLEAKDVEDDSIVFVFVGCSIKALQESGTSVESEKNRAQDFINKRNEGKITIVSWHTGGNARRGQTSDALIKKVVKGSDLFIFAKGGNEDFFLSDTAVNNNVPLYEIDSSSQVRTPLIVLLGSR